MSLVNTYNVFVSSSQRISGTPNNFALLLNPPLQLSSQTHYFACRVMSANIPYSFTALDTLNNQFSVFFNATLVTVTVPPGNYNILALTSVLKGLLAAGILAAAGRAVTWAWTYAKDTGRVTIAYEACDGPSLPSNSIEFLYQSNAVIMQMLGFTAPVVLALGSSVTGTQNVNVNPVQAVYIRSDSLNQVSNKESLIEPDVKSDILAEVPVLTQPGSFISFSNSINQTVRLTNRLVDRVQLYLSSSINYALDLGGLDWTVSLEFTEYRPEFIPPDLTVTAITERQETATRRDTQDSLLREKQRLIEDLEKQKQKLISTL